MDASSPIFRLIVVAVAAWAALCWGAVQAQDGEQLYLRHCAGCHGEKGDGRGPAASSLPDLPTDFRQARFKFQSTPVGELPTDEDLEFSIWHGLNGTSMPSFPALTSADRAALVAHVKTFSPRWQRQKPGQPIAMGEDPFAANPVEGILRGERVYHSLANCYMCHPGYVGLEKLNEYRRAEDQMPLGQVPPDFHASKAIISPHASERPPDFTRDPIKTGARTETLHLRIGAGIGSAAMPTWSKRLPDEDIWAMAHYVEYLAREHRRMPGGDGDEAFGKRYPGGVAALLKQEKPLAAAAEREEAGTSQE